MVVRSSEWLVLIAAAQERLTGSAPCWGSFAALLAMHEDDGQASIRNLEANCRRGPSLMSLAGVLQALRVKVDRELIGRSYLRHVLELALER
jgi:hypothetical protein